MVVTATCRLECCCIAVGWEVIMRTAGTRKGHFSLAWIPVWYGSLCPSWCISCILWCMIWVLCRVLRVACTVSALWCPASTAASCQPSGIVPSTRCLPSLRDPRWRPRPASAPEPPVQAVGSQCSRCWILNILTIVSHVKESSVPPYSAASWSYILVGKISYPVLWCSGGRVLLSPASAPTAHELKINVLHFIIYIFSRL